MWGHTSRSGKLKVLAQILPIWRDQGHKVLLFCQTRQFLSIVETFLATLHLQPSASSSSSPYRYVRLDGTTSLTARQPLIDRCVL